MLLVVYKESETRRQRGRDLKESRRLKRRADRFRNAPRAPPSLSHRPFSAFSAHRLQLTSPLSDQFQVVSGERKGGF